MTELNLERITFDGETAVFTIGGQDYELDTIHGSPVGGQGRPAWEMVVRMNVHFWLVRNGYSDTRETDGELHSSHCPFVWDGSTTEQQFLTLATESPTYDELAAIAEELLRQNKQLEKALDEMTANYLRLMRSTDEPL